MSEGCPELSNGKDGAERRRYFRKEVITGVSYRVIVPSIGEGVTKNISEGGLCLLLDKELPLGTILEIKFELPGEEGCPIETFVRVVWQRKTENGFLTGVKFGT